jgi:hypothetical protein
MKKIKWAVVYSTLLEESKEDIVVENEGRVHIGALLFEADDDQVVKKVIKEVTLPDDTNDMDFLDKIVEVYLSNTSKHPSDAEKTIRHWFSMNGVGAKAVPFDQKDYSKTITIGTRSFRYNKRNSTMEYFDPKKNKVIASIGLSKENANEGLEYWAEQYNDELEYEYQETIKEFSKNKLK